MTPVRLDIGCGARKRGEDWIGIDRQPHACVDRVGDAVEILGSFAPESVDEVYSAHFLEHLDDLDGFLTNLSRVLKPGAKARLVVPHFSNPLYYSDPTHRTPFGLYTFCYLAQSRIFAREVPSYARNENLRLDRVTLGFKASKPFYFRHAVRRGIGALVNLTPFTQELYEDCLCWLFPCYEITYDLSRVSEPATAP